MKESIINNYPKYSVTNSGHIFSLDYNKTGVKKIMKASCSKGYLSVEIYNKYGKKRKTIHRIVAKAFIKNPHALPCVNHKNGIKGDNRLNNLEWVTYSENTVHSYNILKSQSYKRLIEIGKIGNQVRLVITKIFATKIFEEYSKEKTSYRKLATKYNVGKTTVERIITGKGQVYFTKKVKDYLNSKNCS